MPNSLSDILRWTGGRWANEDLIEGKSSSKLEDISVEGISDLGDAKKGDLAFFFSKEFQKDLLTAHPTVLITGDAFIEPLLKSGIPLLKSAVIVSCKDPYLAMARCSGRFSALSSTAYYEQAQGSFDHGESKIHSSAVIDPNAEIGKGVKIGPGVVVEAGAEIGDGSVLHASCNIGESVQMGQGCVIFPQVSLYEKTILGDRVRIHSGCVIGADGFGYAPEVKEGVPLNHEKIYHYGRVRIGHDVEIGASSTIDRGTFSDTIIEDLVKIDNQVQIGHNSHIGTGSIICGCCGLAGGTIIGKWVLVGGMVGIAMKPKVGDGAKIGACSYVFKDIPPGEVMVGNPMREVKLHFRAHAALNKLAKRKHAK